MSRAKGSPEAVGVIRADNENLRLCDCNNLGRALAAFVRGEKHTRLDFWHLYGDSVLPSTVSRLQERFGLRIEREHILVEGRTAKAWVCRYRLSPKERQKARRFLRARKQAA